MRSPTFTSTMSGRQKLKKVWPTSRIDSFSYRMSSRGVKVCLGSPLISQCVKSGAVLSEVTVVM